MPLSGIQIRLGYDALASPAVLGNSLHIKGASIPLALFGNNDYRVPTLS